MQNNHSLSQYLTLKSFPKSPSNQAQKFMALFSYINAREQSHGAK